MIKKKTGIMSKIICAIIFAFLYVREDMLLTRENITVGNESEGLLLIFVPFLEKTKKKALIPW